VKREQSRAQLRQSKLYRTLIAIRELNTGSKELLVSIGKVAVEAGISEDTARKSIAKLQREGIIRLKYPANTVIHKGRLSFFRHPATYTLNQTTFRHFAQSAPAGTREKLFFGTDSFA